MPARMPHARLGVTAAALVLLVLLGTSAFLWRLSGRPAPSRPVVTLGTAEAPPVFSAEFETGPLGDPWAVETPWHQRYTEGELQWYDPDALEFPGGSLRLATRRADHADAASGRTFHYTSAVISTGSRPDYGGRSRAAFTYGYFEMRAKLPKGRGVFPAFWLTNDRESEIDVMELVGQEPRTVYMTLHGRGKGQDRQQREHFTGPDFSAGYHTFAVDWQPGYVRYYVDGVQRAEFTSDVPDTPLWIVANTAVGGSWAGEPDSSTTFPQYYDIDYIRVWRTRPARDAGP